MIRCAYCQLQQHLSMSKKHRSIGFPLEENQVVKHGRKLTTNPKSQCLLILKALEDLQKCRNTYTKPPNSHDFVVPLKSVDISENPHLSLKIAPTKTTPNYGQSSKLFSDLGVLRFHGPWAVSWHDLVPTCTPQGNDEDHEVTASPPNLHRDPPFFRVAGTPKP